MRGPRIVAGPNVFAEKAASGRSVETSRSPSAEAALCRSCEAVVDSWLQGRGFSFDLRGAPLAWHFLVSRISSRTSSRSSQVTKFLPVTACCRVKLSATELGSIPTQADGMPQLQHCNPHAVLLARNLSTPTVRAVSH